MSIDYGLILYINYADKLYEFVGDQSDYSNLSWLDPSPKPTEQDLIDLEASTVDLLNATQYKKDRFSGNAPVYEVITNAGDILQRLITALEDANITGLTIPQECLDYRDSCQAVKAAHPKPA